MFRINDYIIYGDNGVCKIDDICIPPINGIDVNRKYYVLHPVNIAGSKIYIPVDSDKAVIRKIMSYKEAMELINSIPAIETFEIENEKLKDSTYRYIIHKNHGKDMFRILKTLYLKREKRRETGKKLSASDEKYFRITEEYLYNELSFSLGIKKEDMEEFIAEKMKYLETAKSSENSIERG